MPMVLLFAGVLFVVAAVRGDPAKSDLIAAMKNDFTGADNFFYWALAIFVIGAVGYWKPMQPFSKAFMTLILIVLFFSNSGKNGKGFFAQLFAQLGSTNTPASNQRQNVPNPSAAFSNAVGDAAGVLKGLGLPI